MDALSCYASVKLLRFLSFYRCKSLTGSYTCISKILTYTGKRWSIPSVTVSTQADDKVLSITSEVAGKSKIEHVKLFYAYNPTTDWRFREWKSVEMKSMYGSYVGELQRKADEHLAYYVEVGHTGEGGLGYISSLVETLRFDH